MMRRKIRYTIAPGFEILESWVKNLPDFFTAHGVSIFKDRNEVKVFEELGFSLNVKAFKLANLVNQFAYVYLRGSKAARSYQNALRFLDKGASTPVPVAYVECLSYGLLKESFYVSLHFRHNFSLRDVLNRLVPDKENILKQWVNFTWNHLHRHGIYHMDYSPGNTLIQKVNDQYNFAVVDLNRMMFMPVGFEKGIENFRQLDTDEDSLRLIATEYAKFCGESPGKAIELLLKFDKSNKAFRERKNKFNKWRGKD
jgi:serine/threonine protein kinase